MEIGIGIHVGSEGVISGGGGELVTLDPANTNAGLTLSNGNLTIQNSGSSAWRRSRATLARNTGLYCFEVSTSGTYSTSEELQIGVVEESVDMAIDNDFNLVAGAWGFNQDNQRLSPSGNTPIAGTAFKSPVPATMMFSFNLDARTITVTTSDTGATTVDAITGLTPAVDFYPACGVIGVVQTATINFGATPFANPILPGYTSWDGSQSA